MSEKRIHCALIIDDGLLIIEEATCYATLRSVRYGTYCTPSL